MLKILFAPMDKENACGMFTAPHIISLIICIIAIGVALYFARNISDSALKKLTRIFAYVFTAMEIIKIIYKFSYGYTEQLDFWFPLSFCSLFIYALWMAGFGKGLIYKLGVSFIVGGCFMGGASFLVVPATSLMDYPIYHYLSIHSMLFHSCMVFMAILYIRKRYMDVTLKNYRYYAPFVASACILSIILNLIFNANLMIMRNPVNIPIGFINDIYEACPPVFTVFAFLAYIIIPYVVAIAVYRISLLIKNKKNPS
ncbi:MAG: hypothetical protein ACI3XX_03125 [Eubacteriales bacterium]